MCGSAAPSRFTTPPRRGDRTAPRPKPPPPPSLQLAAPASSTPLGAHSPPGVRLTPAAPGSEETTGLHKTPSPAAPGLRPAPPEQVPPQLGRGGRGLRRRAGGPPPLATTPWEGREGPSHLARAAPPSLLDGGAGLAASEGSAGGRAGWKSEKEGRGRGVGMPGAASFLRCRRRRRRGSSSQARRPRPLTPRPLAHSRAVGAALPHPHPGKHSTPHTHTHPRPLLSPSHSLHPPSLAWRARGCARDPALTQRARRRRGPPRAP